MDDWWTSAADEVGELVKSGALDPADTSAGWSDDEAEVDGAASAADVANGDGDDDANRAPTPPPPPPGGFDAYDSSDDEDNSGGDAERHHGGHHSDDNDDDDDHGQKHHRDHATSSPANVDSGSDNNGALLDQDTDGTGESTNSPVSTTQNCARPSEQATPSPIKELLAERRRKSRESAAGQAGILGDTSSVWRELCAIRSSSLSSPADSHNDGSPQPRAAVADNGNEATEASADSLKRAADAVDSLKRAVAASEREHGPDAVPTGRAWHALADASARSGDGRGAALCYSRATQVLEASSDATARLEAAAAAFKFATVCCSEGRFGAAVPAYRRGLLLRRGVLGEWHPALADPAMSLARVLHDQFDGGSAEAAALTAIVVEVLSKNGCTDTALISSVEKMHASMVAKAAADEAAVQETEVVVDAAARDEEDEFV
jgi:hypothetical protein